MHHELHHRLHRGLRLVLGMALAQTLCHTMARAEGLPSGLHKPPATTRGDLFWLGSAPAASLGAERNRPAGLALSGSAGQGLGPLNLGDLRLGPLSLSRLRSGRGQPGDSGWVLSIETDGAWRWAAGVHSDERSRSWASAGLAWPVAEKLTMQLAHARQLQQTGAWHWTLGLRFDL